MSQYFHKHIPRGELLELLFKALLYTEVESHLAGNASSQNCKAPFSLLEHHVCTSDPKPAQIPPPAPVARPAPPAPKPNGVVETTKPPTPVATAQTKDPNAMEVDSSDCNYLLLEIGSKLTREPQHDRLNQSKSAEHRDLPPK
jgi:hypothetical protein